MDRTDWNILFLKVIWRLQNENVPRNRRAILKHPDAPVTNNLKRNALKGKWVEENHYVIYMDERIAPYMPYTNEKWVADKWKGAVNPNENWWQVAVAETIEYMQEELRKVK